MRETLLYALPEPHRRAQFPVYPTSSSCDSGDVTSSGAVVDWAVWCLAGNGLYVASTDQDHPWGWCIVVGRVRSGQILVRKHEGGVDVIIGDGDVVKRWFVRPSGVTDAGMINVGVGGVKIVTDGDNADSVVLGKGNGEVGTVFWEEDQFLTWKMNGERARDGRDENRLFTPGKRVLSLFSRVKLSPQTVSSRPNNDVTGRNAMSPPSSPVASIAKIGDKFLVLHVDGDIACYGIEDEGFYSLKNVIGLELKTTGESCEIVKGGRGAICVVSVDEAPHGDSVRAIEVILEDDSDNHMKTREVAIERRPLDGAVVGVLVMDEGNGRLRIAVGLDSGAVIELGRKERIVWTAKDEVSEERGMWKVGDIGVDDSMDVERLMCPGRFSINTLSKALRAKEISTLSRRDVEEAIHVVLSRSSEEDVDATAENNGYNDRDNMSVVGSRMLFSGPITVEKLIRRAERAALQGDKLLCHIGYVQGVGIVSCRDDGVYVLRPMRAEEERMLGARSAPLSKPETHIYHKLAGGAYGQIIAARPEVASRNRLISVRLSQRASQHNFAISLAEVAAKEIMSMNVAPSESIEFLNSLMKVVTELSGILTPGARALAFLIKNGEMEAVPLVSEVVAASLPATSLYSRALTAVFRRNYDDAFACFVHAATVADQAQSEDLEALSVLLLSRESSDESPSIRFEVLRSALQLLKNRDCMRKLLVSGSNKYTWKIGAEEEADTKLESPASDGVALSAAAATAVEAMEAAPTRASYEQMRASAFTLYLAVQPPNIQGSVAALLKPVPDELIDGAVFKPSNDDQAAVQDSISLLTAACLPLNMSSLTHPPIPEYISHLVLPSLWNLARSTDPLPSSELNSPYMYLYAYLLHHNNPQSAASSALELSARIQALPYHPDGTEETDRAELYRYAKGNTQALTLALAAARILDSDNCPIELTPPTRSILAGLRGCKNEEEIEAVVDAPYIRRRLLLASAVEELDGKLAGLWGVGESWGNRVEWTARTILNRHDRWSEAAELIAAWNNDLNDGISIFRETIVDAVRRELVSRGWDGVAAVLSGGDEIVRRYHLGESVTLGLAGLSAGLEVSGAAPRWLEERAANENLGKTCHLYVRRGRIIDAARVLVGVLERKSTDGEMAFVTADGVLKLLAEQGESERPANTATWHKRLSQALESSVRYGSKVQSDISMALANV